MELKEITAKLKTIPNGANIGITYRSNISNKLNATAKKEGHTIEKEGRVVLRKGLRKDRDPENIPGPRSWGKHVSDEDSTTNGQSFIIEKNGGYYVDFYMGSAGGVGIQAPKYKYFLDGKEVAKEELEPYMQPAAYRLLEKPHDHYSIKIEHVIDIRYNGRRTEGLNEGTSTLGAKKYEVVYQDDDGYGVKQTVITNEDIDDYLEHLYDTGFMYCDVINEEPVNITNVDEAKKVIYVDNKAVPFMENENSVYLIDIDSYEELDEEDDDDLEESYDDYEGRFNDPLEDGEYSLSDFGYKHSYGSDNSTALSKRTREFGSGARRLTKDLNRNNRAANESLRTSYNNRRLNEHISDSEAQRYGYRNAAELKAANKINK